MWKTLIEVQAGTHVPYFPGVDWERVERYDGDVKHAPHNNWQISKGKMTKAVIKDALAQTKYGTVKEIMTITGISESAIKFHLRQMAEMGEVEFEHKPAGLGGRGGYYYAWRIIE